MTTIEIYERMRITTYTNHNNKLETNDNIRESTVESWDLSGWVWVSDSTWHSSHYYFYAFWPAATSPHGRRPPLLSQSLLGRPRAMQRRKAPRASRFRPPLRRERLAPRMAPGHVYYHLDVAWPGFQPPATGCWYAAPPTKRTAAALNFAGYWQDIGTKLDNVTVEHL